MTNNKIVELIKETERGCGEPTDYKEILGEPCGSIFEFDEGRGIKISCKSCQAKLSAYKQCQEIIDKQEEKIKQLELERTNCGNCQFMSDKIKEKDAEWREKIEKLQDWINNKNGTGKYFMSLGIDKLNDKIKELLSEEKAC